MCINVCTIMTMVFVCTFMTTVFVCTLITIVFVCMIINYCFDMVFYINICIAHAKIFIYFTTRNHFKTVGFFFNVSITTQTGAI
jgi:hypothetical protein